MKVDGSGGGPMAWSVGCGGGLVGWFGLLEVLKKMLKIRYELNIVVGPEI